MNKFSSVKHKAEEVHKLLIQIHVLAIFDGVLDSKKKNSIMKSYGRGHHAHLVERMDTFTPHFSQVTGECGPSCRKERLYNGMGVATHAEVGPDNYMWSIFKPTC